MSSKKRYYLWLPYTSMIENKKNEVTFYYKGGEETIAWSQIYLIMFYGSVPTIDQKFLEHCNVHKIPVITHVRNKTTSTLIVPELYYDFNDILAKQIITRNNEKKRFHIARKLLEAKFMSMSWLVPVPKNGLERCRTRKELQLLEAWHAKEYWKKYFHELGQQNFSRRERNTDNKVRYILDAVSKYITGILLRWVIYHRLSPYHGFIHTPPHYPSLLYDLFEPYRGYIDKLIFNTISEHNDKTKEELVAICITRLKEFLYNDIYVIQTRQIVTFHELLHGIVLALRAYLLGDAQRFIPPTPGRPNGGRPVRTGYTLHGRTAGKTDFSSHARACSEAFNMLMSQQSA